MKTSHLKPIFKLIFHKNWNKIHQKVQMTLNYLERYQKLRRLRENMKKVEFDRIDVIYYFKTLVIEMGQLRLLPFRNSIT